MCGIFAALSASSQRLQALEPQLLRGLHSLATRGPDGQGSWCDPQHQIWLGHTRLAVRDIKNGAQPLHSPDGRLHAIVNGELYHSAALRQELRQAGYVFQTQSDAELALALYWQRGLDFVQALRGEFALVLWDGERLIAVRDRFGIKPLCYAQTPDGLFLASKAGALFASGVLAPRWRAEALTQAFCLQYPLPHETLFEQVRQVPPGHLLLARPGSEPTLRAYWDLDYPAASELDSQRLPAAWQADFAQGFAEAVSLRLQADVPICTHLSGGLDSSAVMAEVKRQQTELTSFCVSFPDHPDYDEQLLAAASAQAAGVRLQQVTVRVADLIAQAQQSVMLTEGLAINGHVSAKRLLNQAIGQAGFKVALTGEGADELLLGYAHFRQDLGLANHNPLAAGPHILPAGPSPGSASLQVLQAQWGQVPSFLQAKAGLGHGLQSLLEPEAAARAQPAQAAERLLSLVPKGFASLHPLHRSAYLWIKLALAGYILQTVGDGAEMAHGIEGRLPFLDHRLFESLRTLPPEQQFQQGLEKSLLRQTYAGQLLPAVLNRPKHPFMAPPLTGFPAWRAFLSEVFHSLPLPPGVSLPALQRQLKALETLPPAAHRVWDPIFYLLLSATFLQAHWRLSP